MIGGEFDLVILNMHTDSADDLELTTQLSLLRADSHDVPFVVVIDAEHDCLGTSVLRLFDSRGYFMNSLNPATLASAIRVICAGGPCQPVTSLARARDRAMARVEAKASLPARSSSVPGSAPNPAQEFTTRETDVLRLLQQAKPNKIIAHELSISVNTAKVHVRNIMRKLRATNRTQVVIGVPPRSWSSM